MGVVERTALPAGEAPLLLTAPVAEWACDAITRRLSRVNKTLVALIFWICP
jgi:hypothetical protein